MRFFRLFFILYFLLFASFTVLAGGYVNVRNFPKNEYQGGTQNWAVAQDSLGRMYFGNRDGMLVFDGARWRKYFLPNYTTVRAIMFDKEKERVYVAGSEEFGYFSANDTNGELTYTSLLPNLPNNKPFFTEIWRIFNDGKNIWFQTDFQLFCLADDYIHVFPVDGRITTSNLLNSTMYVGLEDGRVMSLANGRFSPLKHCEALDGNRISAILPYQYNGLLIGTSLGGLFISDNTSIKPFDSPLNNFLKSNQLFCATENKGTYVFGTVNCGAVVTDLSDSATKFINKETGLQNNTVLNTGFDNDHNLWLCLDNGIDYAVLNSPMTSLISHNNTIGAGYSSLLLGDKMIFGTNQGLYSVDYPYIPAPNPPSPQQLLPGQIWAIEKSPHGVLISSDAGIFVYDNDGFNKINNISGAYKAIMLPGSDDTALASTYNAFHLLRWDGDKWTDAGKIEGFNDINGDFIISPDKNIWISHWRKGVYRLCYDERNVKFYDARLYDSTDGFPSNENNEVAFFDNNIIFSTTNGFYTFKENQRKPIVRHQALNKAIPYQNQGELLSFNDGTLAFINKNGVYLADKGNDNNIRVRHTSLGASGSEILPGFVHINSLPWGEMIVSTQDGFSCLNNARESNADWNPTLSISAIFANRDSLVYSTPMRKTGFQKNLELPYTLNSLRIEFFYPAFDYRDRVEYSSYLENYETEWSQYNLEPYREYTHLDEGDYVMHVRMRDNRTGKVQTASFGFSITPPWFRSLPAKIFYYIVIALFLYFSYNFAKKRIAVSRSKLVNRKEEEMQKLREQNEETNIRKDFEIATLKNEQLEQGIMHKSRELSSSTMNLVHLNEVLTKISSQITDIHDLAVAENPKSVVVKPLYKIKESIEKILNNDKDSTTFYKNFDIVYGDFTKRLMEKFPALTPSDKRLCCYIRMGLSSKEIAPLINISYKSVEMARYRLRKKLNLNSENSLTDFLHNF